MDLQLTGHTAVVTGAGRGIGLAICGRLADEGATVIANVRTPSAGLDRLSSTTDTADAVRVVTGDITDPATRDRLVQAAAGRVDILVNNAGIAPARPDGFMAIDQGGWQRTFDLDLFAGIEMIRAVLPVMLVLGHGVVVNVGSINARLADPLVVDYSAAKAALASVAKSLSKAYAPQGIRFNSVDPGPVATDLWTGESGVARTVGRSAGLSADEVAARAASAMPTGRFSTPDEVATLVALLASPLLANVNGAGFVIDGGMFPTL